MSLIRGIHHVSLKCAAGKAEEVVRFYRDLLGLPLVRRWPAGMMFDAGGGLVEVFTDGEGVEGTGAVRHFALATDRPDELIRVVSEAGYPVTVAPRDVVIPSDPPMPARVAFCLGPLGEEIEFFLEK